MKILAGDVGGTKTELAIFDSEQIALSQLTKPLFAKRLVNRDQDGFIPMLQNFLLEAKIQIEQISLAVAGAVRDEQCYMPNLKWELKSSEIREIFQIYHVTLINDLVATAQGMLSLPSEYIRVINSGVPDAQGNLALIAAGTGLGEAVLYRDKDGGYQISASEGGHVDYAPNTDEDIELLKYLRLHFEHVSWERVVSGFGISNIYEFLLSTGRYPECSNITTSIINSLDRAAAISQFADSEDSALCAVVLNKFLYNYGSAAGNLVLKALATGGIFIGGGIAPKLAYRMFNGEFMGGFCNKGRFSQFIEKVPIKLILEPKTALFGAALHSLRPY